MVCKLSIVIPAGGHAGAIIDTAHIPHVGERIRLGSTVIEILEVRELLPPRGEFRFLHATGQVVATDGAVTPAAGAAPTQAA
jgi:hypothetical protein